MGEKKLNNRQKRTGENEKKMRRKENRTNTRTENQLLAKQHLVYYEVVEKGPHVYTLERKKSHLTLVYQNGRH